MLSLPASVRIFVATMPTDMRKGFNGLQGMIGRLLEEDPLSGHLFLFINRRGDKLKVLYWDRDGLAIWYKRLEKGSFQRPVFREGQHKVEIRSDELGMLLGGVDLKSARRRKRFAVAS
jgi:transposase